jgi:hypothetical protein
VVALAEVGLSRDVVGAGFGKAECGVGVHNVCFQIASLNFCFALPTSTYTRLVLNIRRRRHFQNLN